MMRIVCTALTKRIVYAKVSKDGLSLTGNKTDVTSDVLKAVIDKVGIGGTDVVHVDGKPAFEISVKAVSSEPAVVAIEAGLIEQKDAEIARLNAIINTPQSGDFLRAVSIEAEHRQQRWGSSHDAGKAPSDWFWLIGYLAGKALNAHINGDFAKAEHHVITTAAALMNWHAAMFGNTNMRPGIDGEAALASTPAITPEQS